MYIWPKLVRRTWDGSMPRLSSLAHRIAEAAARSRAVVRREVVRRAVVRNASDPRLALVQTVALDTRRRVNLLRCGERHLLLLTGGASDVVIGWLPDEPAPPLPIP